MPPVLWLTAALVALAAYFLSPRTKPYCNAPLLHISFLQKIRNFAGMASLIDSAYKRYNQATFQYDTLRGRRQVLVATDPLISELKNASSETLSFARWSQEVLQMDFCIPLYANGTRMVNWPTFTTKLSHRFFKGTLSKDLATIFPVVHSDLVHGFSPALLQSGLPVFSLVRMAIMPAIARQLVGAPLCRDEGFLVALEAATAQLGIAGQVSSLFPRFMKKWAIRWLTGFEQTKRKIWEACTKLAEERKDDGALQNDFFSIALAAIKDVDQSKDAWNLDRLITEIITNAFAAHHTTSSTIAQTLMELAMRPEYQPILREEVREVIAEKGWTMEAFDAMWKMDSFLRELRRLRPLSDMMLNRLALRETTLSDGTVLTPGTYVSAVYAARETDPRYYDSPEMFDGLRFYKLRQERGEDHRFTDVDSNLYLGFGGGKHPCPGRFFATAVIKASVAMLLMDYEILPGEKKLQMEMRFEEQRLPSVKDRVVFRKL